LVNIVAGKTIVPELIQHQATAPNIVYEVARIFDDPSYREEMRQQLLRVRESLGGPGASKRVAESVLVLP
jgi:lipid-A-disaccharide synthase